MTQLVALGIKPAPIDVAGNLAKGEQIKQAQMQTQLDALKLRDETRKSNALDQYRTGLEQGDPNAGDALTGYPELHQQFQKVFDGAKDDAHRRQMHERAQEFGRLAGELFKYPEGSQKRLDEGDKMMEQLIKEGKITGEMAAAAHAMGYSNLFLLQYSEMGAYSKQLQEQETQKLKAEKTRSEIDKNKAQADYYSKRGDAALIKATGDPTADAKKAIETGRKNAISDFKWEQDAVLKYRKSLEDQFLDQGEIEMQVEKFQDRLHKQLTALRGDTLTTGTKGDNTGIAGKKPPTRSVDTTQQPEQPLRAKDGNGNVIEWNGNAWVPVQ